MISSTAIKSWEIRFGKNLSDLCKSLELLWIHPWSSCIYISYWVFQKFVPSFCPLLFQKLLKLPSRKLSMLFLIHFTLNEWNISSQHGLLYFFLTFFDRQGIECASSLSGSWLTFFQANRSRFFSLSSVFGAGSLYVISSVMLQMFSTGFRSGEFAGHSSLGIKLANSCDNTFEPPLKCTPARRPAQRSSPSLS